MAVQDVKLRLAPGETKEIQRPGRFIFCKFSDRQVSVIMDQARIEMEVGDKHVSTDRFKSFQVQNLDQEREAYLIFVVGDGDFDRMIVQGELSIVPILRNADGTTSPDTRHDLVINVQPYKLSIESFEAFDLIKTNSIAGTGSTGSLICYGPDGTLWNFSETSNGAYPTTIWDPETLDLLYAQEGWRLIQKPDGNISFKSIAYAPENGFIAVNVDNRAWTVSRNVGGFTADYGFLADIAEPGYTFSAIAYDETRGEVVTYYRAGGGAKAVYRDPVTLEKNSELTFDPSITFEGEMWALDPFSGRHCAFGGIGNNEVWIFERNGDFVETVGYPTGFSPGNLSQPMQVNRNDLIVAYESSTARLDIRALTDFASKPEFSAVRPGCEYQAGLLNYQSPQITADITVSETMAGVTVTGEVIKAALEFYLRRVVGDNYLDHVYGLDVSNPGFNRIVTGNETFKRAGVLDDLAITVPAQIVIKIDNELPTAGAL